MSELNLDNIVGFKAVDKDGNEQNVTVDEMVDMVATRMVTALSETSALSEISTLATAAATGNDVYENELPTVTDAANVRVLQSGGEAAQMTMQSLATKLGGLIGVVSESKNGLMSSNGFISRTGIIIPSGGTILDAMTNNMKDGIYQVTGISASDPMKDWGVLIIVGAKFAIFKPLNVRNYFITITRQATTSDWNTPYKFIGNL